MKALPVPRAGAAREKPGAGEPVSAIHVMAQPFSKQALPTAEVSSSSVSNAQPGAFEEEQLWIAVRLPELALQSAEAALRRELPSVSSGSEGRGARKRTFASSRIAPLAHSSPTVVVDSLQGRLCVVAVNDAARSLGIAPGLTLSAAFAFSGSIRVLERAPDAEKTHLEVLAAACQRLTPMVSIDPPESLLLEVRASLKLFGGLPSIRKALSEEIGSRGFIFDSSTAPTPLGALWLARHRSGDALSTKALLARVASLPLQVTRWPAPVLGALKDMGVETVGDCLRLPRHGFARRVGKQYLDDLDKALGRRPDLRCAFESPQSLSFKVELFEESTSLAVFVDAVTRMTEHLAKELHLRQAQVRKLQLVFYSIEQTPTVHRVELLECSSDLRRLLDLLCDKLERIALPHPATAIGLSAGPLQRAQLQTGRLFKGDRAGSDEAAAMRLVERLRGRLGSRAVHGLALAAEHRPERAWVEVIADLNRKAEQQPVSPWAHHRPLWILPAPQPLSCVDAMPCFEGNLRLQHGPERIESGWWDEQSIGRDYFIATNAWGQQLWIYRDHADRHWYLHGIFG
jgi:protein ImuB